ncbi:uncharacterized protein [Anoplolepis gracilipes]|uniref:uncharacterized protein n=1 Tax=Anoplolepis gracilipes TaxID=354296 RepID=UPI003BA0CE02
MCRYILFLVLSCIAFTDVAIALCISSKYENGSLERVTCSNLTDLNTAINYGGPLVTDMMIFQSQIENIPDLSFLRYSKSLVSLNMYDCGIRDISGSAFNNLSRMKKLGLSYNKITSVKNQWFIDLIYLEQLDLSHNQISSIESGAFEKLRGLKRLDVRENRFTCLEPAQLAPMAGIDSIRFSGNPFTFRCRGTLTLWLRDMGISYKTEERGEENWLDSILWLCAADDGKVADSEVLMKECVILNLFNQLRTGLTTAESFPLSIPQECIYARNALTTCVATDRRHSREVVTNGHVVRKLLRQLWESKSTV